MRNRKRTAILSAWCAQMNRKLFSLLTQEDLDQYLMHTIIVRGCDDILSTEQLPMPVALKVFKVRLDAILDAKNLEWDCIQRINSILDLCNGNSCASIGDRTA